MKTKSLLVIPPIVALVLITGLLLFWKIPKKTATICKNCNVIIITLDVLGSNHLPCYGYERNTAPNLCSFAKKNAYFPNSYSVSSLTIPSTFSLLTALYPHVHRVTLPLTVNKLSPEHKTITQTLRKNGYNTLYFGPTAFDHIPLERGIGYGFNSIQDITLGAADTNSSQLDKSLAAFSASAKKNKTFMFIYSKYLHDPWLLNKKKNFLYTDRYYPQIPATEDEMNAVTPEFLSEYKKELLIRISQAKTEESLKLLNSYYVKMTSVSNMNGLTKKFYELPEYEQYNALFIYNYKNKRDPQNLELMNYLRALYDEKIHNLDTLLKPILERIEKEEVFRNTIIIITSQHGEAFAENGLFGHSQYIYNATTSVPLIFKIPGVSAVINNSLIETVDVYPTILGLLGIKTDSKLNGVDFSGAFISERLIPEKNYVISEHNTENSIRHSIQNKYWKLHEIIHNNKTPEFELYNMKTDQWEKTNVASQNPEISGQLLRILHQLYGEKTQQNATPLFPDWIDEQKRQEIIRTGYF